MRRRASLFYLLINYKFYYTGKEWQIKSEAKIVNNAIESYLASNTSADETTTRKYIAYLIAKDKSYVKVDCLKDNNLIWSEKNDKEKYLDDTRTVVQFNSNINNQGITYHITNSEPDYSTLFSSIATFPMLKETPDQGRRPLY